MRKVKTIRITEEQNEMLPFIMADMRKENPHIKTMNAVFLELIRQYKFKNPLVYNGEQKIFEEK